MKTRKMCRWKSMKILNDVKTLISISYDQWVFRRKYSWVPRAQTPLKGGNWVALIIHSRKTPEATNVPPTHTSADESNDGTYNFFIFSLYEIGL